MLFTIYNIHFYFFRKSSSPGLMQVPQCQQVGCDTGNQKSSIFYCNMNEAPNTSRSLSPVESVDSESSCSPEDQSPGSENLQINDGKREIQDTKSPTESIDTKTITTTAVMMTTTTPTMTTTMTTTPTMPTITTITTVNNDNINIETEAVRPMNLPLPEYEVKPPRLKRIAKMKQTKRENRLLSVPNLKFPKNEATICDLRCEESVTSESFTCNLMRRFSKCL